MSKGLELGLNEIKEALLCFFPYMDEIHPRELDDLSERIDRGADTYVAIELGRCSSTDRRIYILHTYCDKPEFDYYGAELVNKKILFNYLKHRK